MNAKLTSYDQLHSAEPEVWAPDSVAALASMLQRAQREGRRVTLRGGGHAFHDQALNDDLVISLGKLDRILEVDAEAQTITVEAGARWGDIVAAALAHDLVPYVVVSTSHTSAGGTMASDGISRHSPSYGSESVHIASFDLLCVGDDAPRTITPEGDGELFRAVVGGFGFLGAVTRICYRLLSVRGLDRSGALQVATRLTAVRSFDELVEEQLLPACEACGALGAHLEARHFSDQADEAAPALYAIAFIEPEMRGAVYRSYYTRGHGARPYLVFRRDHWLRVFLGWLAGFAWIHRIGTRIAWWFIERDAREQVTFFDDAADFLFFMDANVRKKELGARLGVPMPVIQQTFVVPVARTARFLRRASRLLRRRGIVPTLLDVLFMPEDRILMSASYALQGFACTFSFEDVRSDDKVAQVVAALESLSDLCLAHGGRVHFTKNVHVRPETLHAMYGPRLEAFMALKRRLDPDGVLQNGFFERVFAEPMRHATRDAQAGSDGSRLRDAVAT